MTKNCDIEDEEKVALIKNWLGSEGLHFIETLTTKRKEMGKSNIELSNAK